jgi:uncharacterized protein (TIGR02421 family)
VPHFSESELSRLEQASVFLLNAEVQLPVLKTLVWNKTLADEFFKKKEKCLPEPEYQKLDLSTVKLQIASARKLIAGTSPVHLWLQRYADITELTADLLGSVGTAEFYQHSCKLYGSSNTPIADGKRSAIELAKRIDSLLSEFDKGSIRLEPPETLTAYDLKTKLEASLPKYFGAEVPEIRISADMSSKAAAGREYIRLREDAAFSDLDVTQLLQHEALIHIATGKNGRLQKRFPLLGEAYPGNARTQEGLAVFAEFISGALDPHRFKRLADRVIAIDMAEQGADFIELYQYFRDSGASDKPIDAFESAYRVVRGGLVEGRAPFTKDSVYLGGLVEVHSYLRAAVRAGDAAFIRLLFVGKIDLGDLDAMKLLREENLIIEPRFIPPWANDLRYLLSYLAYSTFLNEINLEEVNTRYKNLF